uniref:C-type lectin domain-containing protein n=1 Tax=Tetraodon nigroviridis TaxID=99883 RepID=H3C724_TETNG
MASWSWACLWTSLSAVLSSGAAQPPYYRLLQNQVGFQQAAEACSPGLLASLATQQEKDQVLDLISRSVSPPIHTNLTFWVGLRKANNECMVPVLPLRGFKWTSDGSDVTQVSRWAEEPAHTCTSVLCAALTLRVNGSALAGWGLISVGCKSRHPFICKQKEPPAPTGPGLEPTSAEAEPHPPSPTPDPQEPEGPVSRPDSFNGSQQDPGPGRCPLPSSSVTRSLIPDPIDPGRIQVECWTAEVLVEVRCSGQPRLWRLLDGSVVNFSSVCVPCEDGFQKSSWGMCEDVDECQTGAPCRRSCLNTPGSYRCVCTDETGAVVSEDSSTCKDAAGDPNRGAGAGLLVPVLVALAYW